MPFARRLGGAALGAMIAATGCLGRITDSATDDDGGDQRPPPVVTPGVHCDDERPAPRQVRLLTRREYASTVRDLLGVEVDTASLPVEPRIRGFDNNAAAMVVTPRHMDAFLALAEDAAGRAVRTQRARLVPCEGTGADCAQRVVRELGSRAFRRPLAADEVAGLAAAFAGESFDDGLQIVVTALLASPSFLYRTELGTGSDDVVTLTPHEIASALSYLYWGTMPDAALFAAADADELRTPTQLAAQARRLLADPRARPQVVDFVTQWLRTDDTTSSNKDAAIYPAFTQEIRAAIDLEQRRFVEEVVFARQGHFEDLFLADFAMVNDALARFYGLPPTGSGELTPVAVDPATGRGGLLGLGAVLAVHAHANESSPVRRGLFVRSRLLCQDLAPPPPDLDTTPPGLDPTLTTRERFARHTSDPSCSGCHVFIDGIGFAFEGFDGIGALRSEENGRPVDVSGELVGLDDLDAGDRVSFRGVRELAELLATSERAPACLPLQYFRYARGIEERADDRCAVHNLQLAFADTDRDLQELLVAITALPTFTRRAAN
jgi:hypothetical protein